MKEQVIFELGSVYREPMQVKGFSFGEGEKSMCIVGATRGNEVQQVYLNTVSAKARYASSLVARDSSEEAFRLTKAKYENGKASITEFNEAKNDMLKSESDLSRAKYEYIYQMALIDFYCGKDLKF